MSVCLRAPQSSVASGTGASRGADLLTDPTHFSPDKSGSSRIAQVVKGSLLLGGLGLSYLGLTGGSSSPSCGTSRALTTPSAGTDWSLMPHAASHSLATSIATSILGQKSLPLHVGPLDLGLKKPIQKKLPQQNAEVRTCAVGLLALATGQPAIQLAGIPLLSKCLNIPGVRGEPTFLSSIEIGTNGSNDGFSVQPAEDGGFVVTGTSDNTVISLVKLDQKGQVSWAKRLDTGAEQTDGHAVLKTLDNKFITVLRMNVGTEYPCCGLLKFDSKGTILWFKILDGPSEKIPRYPYSIRGTSDDGFVITGTEWTRDPGQGDILVARLTPEGTPSWAIALGGPDGEVGRRVQQTQDGGVILGGYTEPPGSGLKSTVLSKLTSTGDLSWVKKITALGALSDIQQSRDGGYVLTGPIFGLGKGGLDSLIAKFDSNGSLLWAYIMGGVNHDLGAFFHQTPDGEIILTGAMGISSNVSKPFLAKFHSNGTFLWAKILKNSAKNIGGTSILKTKNGFVIVGSGMRGTGAGGENANILFASLDDDCDIPNCHATELVQPTVKDVTSLLTITTPPFAFERLNNLTVINWPVQVTTQPIRQNMTCIGRTSTETVPASETISRSDKSPTSSPFRSSSFTRSLIPRISSKKEIMPFSAVAAVSGMNYAAAIMYGTISRNIIAVNNLVKCASSLDENDGEMQYIEKLQWDSNPLGIAFGEPLLDTHRGAIIGNMIVIAGFPLFGLGIALIRSHIKKRPFAKSINKLHVPGLIAFPISVLAPATIGAASSMISHSYHTGNSIAGGDIALVSWAALYAAVAPLVLYTRLGLDFRRNGILEDIRPNARNPSTIIAAAEHFISWLMNPTREWKQSPMLEKFEAIIEPVSSPLFPAFDLSTALSLSLLGGIASQCPDRKCCVTSSGLALAINSLYLAAELLSRPRLVRFDGMTMPFLESLAVLVSALSIATNLSQDPASLLDAAEVIANIALYSNLFATSVAALDNVYTIVRAVVQTLKACQKPHSNTERRPISLMDLGNSQELLTITHHTHDRQSRRDRALDDRDRMSRPHRDRSLQFRQDGQGRRGEPSRHSNRFDQTQQLLRPHSSVQRVRPQQSGQDRMPTQNRTSQRHATPMASSSRRQHNAQEGTPLRGNDRASLLESILNPTAPMTTRGEIFARFDQRYNQRRLGRNAN